MAKDYYLYHRDKLVTVVHSSEEAVALRSEYPSEEQVYVTIRTSTGTKLVMSYRPFKVIGMVELGDGFDIDEIVGEFENEAKATTFMSNMSRKNKAKYARIFLKVSSIDYSSRENNKSSYHIKNHKGGEE